LKNSETIRNIAIIAHVDHGKTTLVDRLLQQSGTLARRDRDRERIMDSNDQERERGITILAKCTAIRWRGYRINIVDTPGHADFGGEVERILSMVDSVLLLVDAVEGPMPQTRFVTQKAFQAGINPIVVINKIDRPEARPDWVVDQVFDLFARLGASDRQLDFPVVFTSATRGVAGIESDQLADDMTPLLEVITGQVAPPEVDLDGPLQLQVCALDYSSYIGVIGLGRISRGRLRPGQPVVVVDREGKSRPGKVLSVMGHMGLERSEIEEAEAGDIISLSGIEGLQISDTICAPEQPEALPPLTVDEPTVSMTFQVNDSPFAGREGKYVTSRNLKERLEKELIHDVALRVTPGESPDRFVVAGRGELHLSVLIEKMRREGYEMGVSRPEVIIREIDGRPHEPVERAVVDVPNEHVGTVTQAAAPRKGKIADLRPGDTGRTIVTLTAPARGLLGFRSLLMTATRGTALIHQHHEGWMPWAGDLPHRQGGAMVSDRLGTSTGFALDNLQKRGELFIGPNVEVYEGMIIGEASRPEDMQVNPTKAKQLTNIRTHSTDEAIKLKPPREMTLELAIEWISGDELVEVTPNAIRVRKRYLTESERKKRKQR